MNRTKVSSSSLASVAYDATSSTLEVEFQNGSVYRYFDVPESTYANLMQAESVGGHFAEHVKEAGFRFERLR
jgi:hypothetical protein